MLLYEWLRDAATSSGGAKALVYRDTYLSWRGLIHRVARQEQAGTATGEPAPPAGDAAHLRHLRFGSRAPDLGASPLQQAQRTAVRRRAADRPLHLDLLGLGQGGDPHPGQSRGGGAE